MRAVAALAGGGQGGANLGGVVAVVVDDGDAAGLAAQLEAAVDAAKMVEALGDFVGGNFKLVGDGDGGGGVEHVVAAGDVEFEGTERSGSGVHLKAGEAARAPAGEELEAVVGLGGDAVGEDAAAGAGQNGRRAADCRCRR